jgi:predicted MFS family arabinose efflux permease
VATVALYLVSATFAALWWRIESRSANPLIDIAMIRLPTVRASNVVSFLLGVSLFVPYTFLPQILQTPRETGYGFGLTVTTSGLVLLPMSVAMVAGGLTSARLVRRFAARSVLAATCGVMAVCILLFGVAHDAIWRLAITLVAYGFSMGIALAALAALIVVSVPMDQSAVAGAVNFNIRNLAAAVGVALMATIVTSALGPTGLPLDSGYRLGFVIMAAGAAAAAVLSLTLPARQRTSVAA